MSRTERCGQYLGDDVEVHRHEEGGLSGVAYLVLIERRIRSLDARILYARPGGGADVGEAAGIARRTRRAVRCAGRNGLVIPDGLVVKPVVLPIGAGDRAQ